MTYGSDQLFNTTFQYVNGQQAPGGWDFFVESVKMAMAYTLSS